MNRERIPSPSIHFPNAREMVSINLLPLSFFFLLIVQLPCFSLSLSDWIRLSVCLSLIALFSFPLLWLIGFFFQMTPWHIVRSICTDRKTKSFKLQTNGWEAEVPILFPLLVGCHLCTYVHLDTHKNVRCEAMPMTLGCMVSTNTYYWIKMQLQHKMYATKLQLGYHYPFTHTHKSSQLHFR